tara:strand:+ start:345 stop:476 length:132 start_codon:yes stop_codon:yes gene_type:complete
VVEQVVLVIHLVLLETVQLEVQVVVVELETPQVVLQEQEILLP